jgi:hypothetical protein
VKREKAGVPIEEGSRAKQHDRVGLERRTKRRHGRSSSRGSSRALERCLPGNEPFSRCSMHPDVAVVRRSQTQAGTQAQGKVGANLLPLSRTSAPILRALQTVPQPVVGT